MMFEANPQHAVELQQLFAQRPGAPFADAFQHDPVSVDVPAAHHHDVADLRILIAQMAPHARGDLPVGQADEMENVGEPDTRQIERRIRDELRDGLRAGRLMHEGSGGKRCSNRCQPCRPVSLPTIGRIA
ncbi:hypothetical protein GAS19_26295 [Burkholderia glumae]|uniref:hypothetical protein n=1 Tax=Burkholderia glumae TaxID=337 RepID=UPI0012950A38|nr:hypothetical protein [Burkholderia glumae]QGA40934.1 hypothetical protein GAS19_26295 [Burkholderia glumae]